MTPDQILAAFRKEGLTVVEIRGWRVNDRGPATGRPTGPKHGLVNHHTGGDTSNPYGYASSVLFKGYSGLPGPLCHQGLDPDTGTLYMVGTGRTNHAGGGDPAVLAAVKAETVPYDRELKPSKGNSDGVDGNAPYYGLEVMYSGARDVPKVGYVAIVKWNTAICRFHGWSGASAIAHREWSNDKPDPGRVNLPQLRRDVDAALAMPAGAWGTTTTPPPKDDNMTLTADDRAFITQTEHDQTIWMWREPEVSNIIAAAAEVGCARALGKNVAQAEAKLIDAVAAVQSRGEAAPDCAEPSRHNV
jgi:hypothetical protein